MRPRHLYIHNIYEPLDRVYVLIKSDPTRTTGPCRAVSYVSPADPGVLSMIQARSHFFVKIDHEIIFTAILPSADSRRVVVSYKRKYVHQVLVNCLVKLIQEKSMAG